MKRVDVEHKLERLRAKQQKLDRIWAKTGNKDLLQLFVDIMPRVLDVDRISIFILDPEEETVWLQCGTGLRERQLVVPTSGSVVGRVISSGQMWEDMELESSVGEHDVVSVKTGFIARNILCVPVFGVTTQGVTGAIQVLNKHSPAGYTEEDRMLLERLAEQIQLNIESIYLRQEMAKIADMMRQKVGRLERLLNQSV